MLVVNRALSDSELQITLRGRCAKFGTVLSIRLLPVVEKTDRLAFVQMATSSQSLELAGDLRATTFGDRTVLIRLTNSAE